MGVQSIVSEIEKLCFSSETSIVGDQHSKFITSLGYLLRMNSYKVRNDYPLSFLHRTIKTGKVQRRWGYIDLFAEGLNHKIAIEYDAHRLLKYKSIEKLLQSDADTLIGIVGNGTLNHNIQRILQVMEGSGIMNRKVLLIAMSEKDSEEIFW